MGIRAYKAFLIAAMAFGSVAMWLGSPVFWIYVASQLSSASQITMKTILVVLFGIPISMYTIAKGLARLDEVYGDLDGPHEQRTVRPPWMRSMRDARDMHKERTVLDTVMVVSVSLALTAFGIWFAFFAKGGGI